MVRTNREKREKEVNLQTIAASKGVKKLGLKEGRTKEVAGVRLTWKANNSSNRRQVFYLT